MWDARNANLVPPPNAYALAKGIPLSAQCYDRSGPALASINVDEDNGQDPDRDNESAFSILLSRLSDITLAKPLPDPPQHPSLLQHAMKELHIRFTKVQ